MIRRAAGAGVVWLAAVCVAAGMAPSLYVPGESVAGGTAKVWQATGVVPSAQGTISLRVRIPEDAPLAKDKDPSRELVPLLTLTGGGGGTWTLSAVDQTWLPPEGSAPEAPGGAEGEDNLALDEDPAARFWCRVQVMPFGPGQPGTSITAAPEVMKRGQWHHVVWTWHSVNHTLYVDGKPHTGLQAVSRLAPPTKADGALKLLAQNLTVADLRVYPRAVEAAEIPKLAAGGEPAIAVAPLRAWADWGYTTGRAVLFVDVGEVPAASVSFRCVEAASGKALTEGRLENLPSGLGESLVRVSEPEAFPPGTYRFEVAALDAAGRELGRAATADWKAEKQDWVWLGSRAGLDKTIKILPPYTAIEAKDGALSTAMRRHVLDRTGFFKSVEAAGADVLSAPVTLEVRSAGRALEFSGGAGVGAMDNRGDEADWTASTVTPEGHALRVTGHIEYDGVTRFDVALVPKGPLKVEGAVLRIPFRPETARLLHTKQANWWHFVEIVPNAAGGFAARRINWNIGAPKERQRREGVVYDAFDIGNDAPAPYPFAPFVHVGNFHRGLAWFVDNDAGWVHDPGRTPPMEFVATDRERCLKLNLIARPTELTAPWTVRFYLLANPYKPLPKDWRTWVVAQYQQADDVAKRSAHRFWFHWSEYALSFRPYPGGGEPGKPLDEATKKAAATSADPAARTRYEDWIGKFTKDPLRHAPFVNFGTPGGFAVWDKETMVYPYTWKLHNNAGTLAYMAYWMDRCAREVGIRGVYVDEPYVEPYSYNVLAGDAPWLRADGTRGMGYRFLEGREYFRRLRQVFAELGNDYSVWAHTTNYKPPFYTFVDIGMDGEHPSIWVPVFDNYHIFYNPVMSRGYLAGQPYGYVGTMMFHGNTNPNPAKDPNAHTRIYTKTRTYLAVSLPYGVLPQTASFEDELFRANNIRAAFGISDGDLRELTLGEEEQWMPGSRFEPALACSGDLAPSRHRALLYTSAVTSETFRYEVVGGFKGLALGKPHAHAWNAENGVSLAVEGKTVFETRPLDFGAILVEGRDTPQAPRPDGAVLGVSFDKGMAPDFGGGMVPEAADPDAGAPVPAPGRGGQCLGGGGASYPVVPSWFAGTVECEVRLSGGPARPVRLLGLKHHLDLDLYVAQKDGRLGLKLVALELDPDPVVAYATQKKAPPVKRELWAPVAAPKPEEWNRVTLVWRSGQYDLYWNGGLAGRSQGAVSPRLRDAQAMAHGVMVGAGEGVSVDSLIVYDWPFRAADAAGGGAREGLRVVARPALSEDFPVWVWGKGEHDCRVAINLAGCAALPRATSARFVMQEKGGGPVLATAEVVPWLGTGAGFGKLTPNAKAAVPEAALGTSAEGDDLLGELGMESRRMEVELLNGTNGFARRTVDLKLDAGSLGLQAEY